MTNDHVTNKENDDAAVTHVSYVWRNLRSRACLWQRCSSAYLTNETCWWSDQSVAIRRAGQCSCRHDHTSSALTPQCDETADITPNHSAAATNKPNPMSYAPMLVQQSAHVLLSLLSASALYVSIIWALKSAAPSKGRTSCQQHFLICFDVYSPTRLSIRTTLKVCVYLLKRFPTAAMVAYQYNHCSELAVPSSACWKLRHMHPSAH
jgi:hypothetical protein